jgi:hypothetical protein
LGDESVSSRGRKRKNRAGAKKNSRGREQMNLSFRVQSLIDTIVMPSSDRGHKI